MIKKQYEHRFNLDDNLFLLSKTNQPNLFSEEIVKYIENKTDFQIKDNTPFAFIDIGCGSGKLSFKLIDYFMEKGPVEATLIEPMRAAIDITKECHKSSKSSLISARINIIQSRFEDFIPLPANKYHFLLLSHVIYYFKDWQAATKRVFELMLPNGLCCLIIKDDNELEVFNLRTKIFKLLGFDPGYQLQTSRDLKKTLDSFSSCFDVIPFEYDVILPLSSANFKNDLVKVLRFIFHFPLHSVMDQKDISCLLDNFVAGNTIENELRFRMRDSFFWIASG